MAEEWRVVESHPSYMVSTDGKVMGKHGNILKPGVCNGRYFVRLDEEKITVHRLVANAFIENPDSLPIINHKDGDPKNNRVDNLEWCSFKKNSVHARDVLGSFDKQAFPVMCVETGRVYETCASAAKAVSGNKDAIWRCANGERKTHRGLHWTAVSIDRQSSREERIVSYCQSSVSSLKDESNAQIKEKRRFKKLLFLHNISANSIAEILGCSYPTASKKLNLPSEFKFRELVSISNESGISMQELFDSLMIEDQEEQDAQDSIPG